MKKLQVNAKQGDFLKSLHYHPLTLLAVIRNIFFLYFCPIGSNQNDMLVSKFTIQKPLNVGEEWSTDEMSGVHQTQLKYSYRVVCSEHYYGESCSRLCKPRDDRFGHYICESDGSVSCLKGWKGEYCSKRKLYFPRLYNSHSQPICGSVGFFWRWLGVP